MSSNDLTQVRDYINTRVAIVDSDLIEWTDSLEDIGNIPKTILDRSYHITLGANTSSVTSDIFIEDNFPVVVTIFKRAFNTPVVSRDTLLQKGNCIRLDIINIKNVETYKAANDGNILDVQSVSITPSEIDTSNDNIIKVEVGLNVRLFYKTT